MEITKKSRSFLRLQNLIFYTSFLVLVGLIAYLSQLYDIKFDWTATSRHSLSDASIKLLNRMPNEIKIMVFVRPSEIQPLRKKISDKLSQYQDIKKNINIEYINPDSNPDLVRQESIKVDGEIIVTYNNRSEHLMRLSEELLSNSLLRLLRSNERVISFISGHGERRASGKANYDLQNFVSHLQKSGFSINTIDLNQLPTISDKTAALVIASPQIALLATEVNIIIEYIRNGGNLLWLHEPGEIYGMQALANELGIEFITGTIVDPSAQKYGISSPSNSIISKYGKHAIINNFLLITVFPQAVAIRQKQSDSDSDSDSKLNSDWKFVPILKTVPRSWSETGVLQGSIDFSADKDIPGPLNIGMTLTRNIKASQSAQLSDNKIQRIVVLGDGDFISNTFLGNQGNLDLGVNIFNWISYDDNIISIPAKIAVDTHITLSQQLWWFIALLFLIVLPLALIIIGLSIWIKRKKR